MGYLEKEIAREHLQTLGVDQRRARISCGSAWVSDKVLHVKRPTEVKLFPGDIVLRGGRAFHGAPAGTADYVGFDSVVVTPDMVGQRVAIFAADEIKSPRDRLSKLQKRFKAMVIRLGGRWREIHSSE
jgi:hypothetical protein